MTNTVSFGRKKALLEGVLAGTLFGTAAILIRLLKIVNVFSIAFWRLCIAFLVLATAIGFLRKSFEFSLLKKNILQALFLGALLGSHFILFASAVLDTTIINATVLVNTTPIWSLLISVLIFNVKPTRLAVLGLFVTFLGVTTIAYADVASSPTFSFNLKGDLEALFAAVVEAFYLSYGRDTRRKMPILSLMLLVYVLSTLTVLVASLLVGSQPVFFTMNLEILLILVALGVLPTALAHTLYFSSLFSLKSFETATLALLEPITATLFGVLIFTEIPNALFILGAIFVLGGIISVAIQK